MLVSLSTTTQAATGCQLLQVGELQVTMPDNAPVVPASIEGHAVQMLVDTGADKSLIWRSATKDLNLSIQPGGPTFYGAGGGDTAGLVWIHDFGLAGTTVHNVQLYTTGRGALPGAAAGVLGEDVLSRWDIEFDLSAGKIRLFVPKNCKGDEVVYWATSYFMTKLVAPPGNSDLLETTVRLNGQEAVAMLDTGASASVVTAQALRQAGVTAESPVTTSDPTRGIVGKPINTSIAVFASLSIGQETIQNVKLRIADLFGRDTEVHTGSAIAQSMFKGPEMLIGADFFLAHRILVSRSQGRIYFTYKGGPIFQRIAPEATAPAAPPGESGTGTPKQQ
jgi:predicted aspartyl protease